MLRGRKDILVSIAFLIHYGRHRIHSIFTIFTERLVHGPLTALMLLETTKFHHCSTEFEFFEYRARNPVIVNRPITIHGAWVAENAIELWTLDDEGIVGMTGNITTKQRGDT